jgi:hypothetical protein
VGVAALAGRVDRQPRGVPRVAGVRGRPGAPARHSDVIGCNTLSGALPRRCNVAEEHRTTCYIPEGV